MGNNSGPTPHHAGIELDNVVSLLQKFLNENGVVLSGKVMMKVLKADGSVVTSDTLTLTAEVSPALVGELPGHVICEHRNVLLPPDSSCCYLEASCMDRNTELPIITTADTTHNTGASPWFEQGLLASYGVQDAQLLGTTCMTDPSSPSHFSTDDFASLMFEKATSNASENNYWFSLNESLTGSNVSNFQISTCSNSSDRRLPEGMGDGYTNLYRPDTAPRLLIAADVRSARSSASTRVANRGKIIAVPGALRSDYLEFLKTELPRWAQWGFLEPTSNVEGLGMADRSEYYNLHVAYSTVCQLQNRMGDDAIRNRIALFKLHKEYVLAVSAHESPGGGRGVGRGNASYIIDTILRRNHQGWTMLSDTERNAKRALFHDRKRYGKRWATLADQLGKGILMVCSPQLAKHVCNTAFTYKMITTVIDQVRSNDEHTRVLNSIREIAEMLYRGEACDSREVERFLGQIEH